MIRQANGDLDGALADYSKALALNPRLTPAFGLIGYLRYDRHEFAEAITVLGQACQVDQTNEYPHFWLWLASSRLRSAADADRELKTYLDSRKDKGSGDWPGKVGDFLLGRVAESDFLKSAESADQEKDSQHHCEAWFYVAEKRLLAGDRATAARYFEKCIATQERTLTEYDSAKQELHFLSAATNEVDW
jgi:lipoprotein NlpI